MFSFLNDAAGDPAVELCHIIWSYSIAFMVLFPHFKYQHVVENVIPCAES